MAKTKIFAMEKPASANKKFIESLKNYLRKKAELKELEDEVKKMEAVVFKNPELLPETIEVDGVDWKKQKRNPTVNITNKMIEDAGLDLERILPLATFSSTMVKTVYGESGKKAVEETDAYCDEFAMKTISIFYKKS